MAVTGCAMQYLLLPRFAITCLQLCGAMGAHISIPLLVPGHPICFACASVVCLPFTNLEHVWQAAGQMMADPEVSRGVTGMIESLGQRAGGSRAVQAGQISQQGRGAEAGGLGAILNSLGPMMQQLAVGSSAPGSGAQQRTASADGGNSSSNWQAALSELDDDERPEWERTIRYCHTLRAYG